MTRSGVLSFVLSGVLLGQFFKWGAGTLELAGITLNLVTLLAGFFEGLECLAKGFINSVDLSANKNLIRVPLLTLDGLDVVVPSHDAPPG